MTNRILIASIAGLAAVALSACQKSPSNSNSNTGAPVGVAKAGEDAVNLKVTGMV